MKHVFCEKPLALTKAGAEKAVALCRDARLVLGMGHERRWEPPIADMLAKADAGALGRIHQIEANFSHDKFLALDRDNWRLKAEHAPAGGMTATGIHLLDLSVRLLGPAESVLCICERLSSDLPQGDTVAAYVKFKGGGTSYVSASLANPSCRALPSTARRAGSTFATRRMWRRRTAGSSRPRRLADRSPRSRFRLPSR